MMSRSAASIVGFALVAGLPLAGCSSGSQPLLHIAAPAGPGWVW